MSAPTTPARRFWAAAWAVPVAVWGLIREVAAYVVTERVSFFDMFLILWFSKALSDHEWGLAAGILVGGAIIAVTLKGIGRVS